MDVQVRTDPVTGARCAFLRLVPGDPNSAEAQANEQAAIELTNLYGVCANSPRQANGAVTPATAAALVWQDRVELPDPVLRIQPGHAIAGKPAYLEITSPRSMTETATAFGQTVELHITSVLDVDWDDGTVERGVTRQGGAWPAGDITHVYTDDTTHAVHVVQRWEATWRVGTQTGRITDQLFTESTLPLEVRELQAVRER